MVQQVDTRNLLHPLSLLMGCCRCRLVRGPIDGVGEINGVVLPTTSFGKVLQVVAGVTTTSTATTSTSFVATTLTATITPTSASNTILVIVSQNGMQRATTGGINVNLYRDATEIAMLVRFGGNTNTSLYNNFGSVSGSYIDSPATTSAVVYSTKFASETGTNNTVNAYGARSSIVLMEVSA
jgi:hypothetical protein